MIDAQPAQTGVAGRLHIFRPAVDAEHPSIFAAHITEFSSDNHIVPAAADGPADQLFISAHTVHIRCVQKVDSEFKSPVNGAYRLLIIPAAVEIGHAHTAESKRRYLKPFTAQCSDIHLLFHLSSSDIFVQLSKLQSIHYSPRLQIAKKGQAAVMPLIPETLPLCYSSRPSYKNPEKSA
ncbi:hypothetical protein D3C73_750700 [compost metagenome]